MKQNPDDRPLTPSIRFMALMMPTAAKTVSMYDAHCGMLPTPHNPQKQFIDDLLANISHAMTIISMAKRMFGERSIMSSIVPVYSMTSIADMSMNVFALLNIACELQRPMTMPKNTAIPPITGTGLRCSFLASGLSTRFFSIAILRTFGCIHSVPKKASSIGSTICWMFDILDILDMVEKL